MYNYNLSAGQQKRDDIEGEFKIWPVLVIRFDIFHETQPQRT